MSEFDGLPLFTEPVPPPPPVEPLVDGHARDARAWMEAHHDAMSLFEALALTAADRGKKFGMKALAERVRWQFVIDRDGDSFKINNNHVSHIARELIRRHPRLSDFIELRRTQEED